VIQFQRKKMSFVCSHILEEHGGTLLKLENKTKFGYIAKQIVNIA